MIRHIVLFKFKEEVSDELRCEAFKAFKEGIENLTEIIPFIREVHVGKNCNEAEKWDICLYSVFGNLDDVKAYSIHPAHKAIASELMKLIQERACVDFEF